MKISRLIMKNFRSYGSSEVEFGGGTNVIYGDNAQGKTNILEAVYLFCQGRSHRARADSELISFGESFARLQMEFSDSQREYRAFMQIDRSGRKLIKINNVPIKKLSRLMSYFNVVLFSPEDLELVKGSPGTRRRFIDSSMSQLYPAYLTSLMTYHKALAQKNSLLKELKRRGARSDDTLSVWNDALAEEGAKLMRYRADFVARINALAKATADEISGEKTELCYCSGINISEPAKEAYFEYLESHAQREIELGAGHFGIQRDDISVLLNGKDARLFASQGQQRTLALSMRIAEADFINSVRDEYPVLLLDDIMSELDSGRRRYLWERIRDKQVLITCTDKEAVQSSGTSVFHVSGGSVERES